MHQAFEATIDQSGVVHLNETVRLTGVRRALVIVLDDTTQSDLDETALLSEESLAEGWNRPDEDAAWAYLQSEQ